MREDAAVVSGPGLGAPKGLDRIGPWLAWGLAMAFVAVRLFTPDYIDNEPAYSLGPMTVLDGTYLARQFLLREMSAISVVYNVLVAPLFLAFGPFGGTLVCRLLIWAFQLWALLRLLRAFGIPPWGLPLLLALWLNVEQTLVAGEWVIGCASTKPIAYGFVFLAVEALVRRDWKRLPVWCGLATCFHVLVGGWTTLAVLSVALPLAWGEIGWRGFLRFGLLAGLLALPAIGPGLASVEVVEPRVAAEAAAISVHFANPFHQDPAFFLSPPEAVKVGVMAAASLAMAVTLLPRGVGLPVAGFLGTLCAFFLGGLVAARFGLDRLLMFYPFRVADAAIPLFFWIGVVALLARWHRRRPSLAWALLLVPLVGLAGWLVDRADTAHQYAGARGFGRALAHTEPRTTAYWTRETGRAWLARWRGERTDFERLQDWARASTPRAAVFITPPWEVNWPIRAERATMISFKVITAGPGLVEWKARFEALHGGPFQGVGFQILKELRASYPRLTRERVQAITGMFPADYLVALAPIPGLEEVHREGQYVVYRLAARSSE